MRMTIGEVFREVEQIRRDRVRLNKVDSDVTRLSVRVESFTQKLSTPGTKFLVNLEYRLVYDTVVTVPNITATFGAVFETLPGALHAVYVISAFATTNLTVQVLTDGPIIVGPGSLCTVAIARQQKAAPTRIESTIIYYQNTGAPLDVSVRVWRRLGMGS